MTHSYKRGLSSIEERLPLLSFCFIFVLFFFASPYDLFWTTREVLTDLDTARFVVRGTLERQISLSLLGIFGIISLLKGGGRFRVEIRSGIALLLAFYFFWAGLSPLWADDLGVTLKKIAVFALFYLGALGVARSFSVRQVAYFAFFSSLLTVTMSFGAEVILGTFQPFDGDYRFSGVMHPNHQGWNCVLLFISSFLFIKSTGWKDNWHYYATASFALMFLLLSRSRAAVWGLLTAFILGRILTSSSRARFGLILGIMGATALVYLAVINGFGIDTVVRYLSLGRDTDASRLSGRAALWRLCIDFIMARPVMGYGYNAFWTPKHITAISGGTNWTVAASHNGYLDVALGVGVIGALAFILALILTIIESSRIYRLVGRKEYIFIVLILLFVGADSMFESIGSTVSIMNFLFWIAFFKIGFCRAEFKRHAELFDGLSFPRLKVE